MTGLDRHYHALGLQPGASAQEIKQAYRDLAKVWHPDRFLGDPRLQARAQEQFKEIQQAYHALQTQGIRRTTFDDGHPPPRHRSPSNSFQQQSTSRSSYRPSRYGPVSNPELAYRRFIAVAKVIALVLTVILVRQILSLLLGDPVAP